ncbi:hypothetical protein ACNOYE_06600 [Nannocystaceae bacterium ST9]
MLLGGHDSGKTHYAAQLYGRLRRRPGELRLRELAARLRISVPLRKSSCVWEGVVRQGIPRPVHGRS